MVLTAVNKFVTTVMDHMNVFALMVMNLTVMASHAEVS